MFLKKYFIATAIIFLLSHDLYACEICGCGVGNYYIGLLPQFKTRFAGLRYHYNKFNTRLTSDPSQYSKDFYQTVELWSGWNIGRRFQLLTFVPVNFNHQESDEGVSSMKGLGDIMAMINYKILDTRSKNNNNKNVYQQLWLGAGIKFPTGNFSIEASDPDVASAANMQLGSGSTDILLNGTYNIRMSKVSMSTQTIYKINSTNKEDYRFGNKFTASSFIAYSLSEKMLSIRPNIGLLYENTEESQLNSAKVNLTGGSLLQGAIGAEFAYNRISFGFSALLPLTQNFADNQTKQKSKGMIQVSIAF